MTAELHGPVSNVDAPRKQWPVIEVFGPTIQGEGPDAGRRCWFVRFGGCDFRCAWCDSMHAVEPALVRDATRMSTSDIIVHLAKRGATSGSLVILSGGNPALHKLGNLIRWLHHAGMRASVETQGSVWRDWLADVDRLVVSPKPPSSGMVNEKHAHQFDGFMTRALGARLENEGVADVTLKIVVANEVDFRWAQTVHARYPNVPLYLSVCTPAFLAVPESDPRHHAREGAIHHTIRERYRWLCERVAADTTIDAVVLPQLHVIAWGSKAGV